ncbi:hypothetical protein BG011_005808 [Mortierella polycephala]|uniref:Uncharacterized protein n=1 Tax=Mortierella polycephala TaxID=41804 RepID=A0A9P6PUG5_9FUNG|nr:hypothetical protein BG011_005808 [Mortierella polycephala]
MAKDTYGKVHVSSNSCSSFQDGSDSHRNAAMQVVYPMQHRQHPFESLPSTTANTHRYTPPHDGFSYRRSSCSSASSFLGSPTKKSAEWLDWLVRTAAVNSSDCISTEFLREPMLLNLSLDSHAEFASQGIQRRHGFNARPGVLYYSQGTEEASRTKSPIQPSAAPSTRAKPSTHSNNNGNNNINNNNINNNIDSYTIPTRSWACESQESPLTEEVPSPSSQSNQTTSNTHRTTSRNREEADRKASAHSSSVSATSATSATVRSSTASVGAGSTSALLNTTGQEFHQIWNQTTAFLYRTFSPTYRVGHLYLESWTNGTQKRGFERLQTSLVRGDTFLLVRNTTAQLRDLWARSMAASRAREEDAKRHLKTIEDQRRQGHRHDGNQGPKSSNNNDNSSGSGGASENDQPRNQ